jgi:hypothetical protein
MSTIEKRGGGEKRAIILVSVVVLGAMAMFGGFKNSGTSSPSSSTPYKTATAPVVGEKMTEGYIRYVQDDLKAEKNCRREIENLAKYDLKWTSWTTTFEYNNANARADGYVRFIGDNAQAQNGFGGWVRVNYECLYDPSNQQVARVKMDNGKLPNDLATENNR